MEPDRSNAMEVEGVLNPAAARSRDGQLYLFPRLVGKGNYSRIGIARVLFDGSGDPYGVERAGIALEPHEEFEKNPHTGGGCEDPRITFITAFDAYVMTYTAYGPRGARIALAASRDLLTWERLGLVRFGETAPVNFNNVTNKDGVLFPAAIRDPDGEPSIGLIHRPLFPGSHPHEVLDELHRQRRARETDETPANRKPRLHHESLWISYCSRPTRPEHLCDLQAHHRLLSPRASWERIKVGAGAPPVWTKHGWLLIYHGVGGQLDGARKRLRYSAGALVLGESPEDIVYRSRRPILAPQESEREGVVPNVVFPTGIDQRTDIGQPNRLDVYYGMADDRIGVATLTIPRRLPPMAEGPEARRDAA